MLLSQQTSDAQKMALGGVAKPINEVVWRSSILNLAKRNAETWYIGGMTGERKAPLEMEVALDFLPENQTFTLTSFEDGINADRQAMHYTKSSRQVRKGDTIKVRMVRNGGYAATIE